MGFFPVGAGGAQGLTAPVDVQGAAGANPVFGAGTTGDTFNRVEMRANGDIAMGTGALTPDTTIHRSGIGVIQFTGKVQISGNVLDISTAGQGLQVAEGSNAKQGTFALAGAATTVVANTSVTATSRILLTCQTLGTVTTASTLAVSARSVGTSFTVTPSQATDTSTIAFEIFEPG